MQHDDLILIRTALALNIEDWLALALREVPDINSLDLAGTKTVEQHQRDHQPVAAADYGFGINAVQQPKCLLRREWQLAILGMPLAAFDAGSNILIVTMPFTKPIEEF